MNRITYNQVNTCLEKKLDDLNHQNSGGVSAITSFLPGTRAWENGQKIKEISKILSALPNKESPVSSLLLPYLSSFIEEQPVVCAEEKASTKKITLDFEGHTIRISKELLMRKSLLFKKAFEADPNQKVFEFEEDNPSDLKELISYLMGSIPSSFSKNIYDMAMKYGVQELIDFYHFQLAFNYSKLSESEKIHVLKSCPKSKKFKQLADEEFLRYIKSYVKDTDYLRAWSVANKWIFPKSRRFLKEAFLKTVKKQRCSAKMFLDIFREIHQFVPDTAWQESIGKRASLSEDAFLRDLWEQGSKMDGIKLKIQDLIANFCYNHPDVDLSDWEELPQDLARAIGQRQIADLV